MITGFEAQTIELSNEELRCVQLMIPSLKARVGKEKAVTSQQIINWLKNNYGILTTGPRVRKMINYIRINRLVENLVATSEGYYVETDPKKVREYVMSLHQRAEAIMAVANSYSKLL
jgi:hypothetical protein